MIINSAIDPHPAFETAIRQPARRDWDYALDDLQQRNGPALADLLYSTPPPIVILHF